MRKQNPAYIYQSQQMVENTEDFISHVKKYILEEKGLNDLRINNINMCYNLGQYMDLRDELENCKEKIFKIKNDPHMIKINSKKGDLIKNRYYYFIPLDFIWIYCIRCKDKPLVTLEKQKKDLEKQIEFEINNNFEVISEKNFTGYMFVSFELIQDKEKILQKYPHQFFDIVVDFFKNIKFYICCCCISKGEKIKFNKIKGIDVDDPPEPEDLYWENFKYTGRQRFFKILLFFLACILIIGVSFAIVLGFTYWQNKITANEKNINLFVKYLLSLFITIIIALLNAALEYLLEKFTHWERHLSRTNYYLSLSIKIAIFTFLNSAVVPLIAKELAVKKRIKDISYNIDRNNLIVDDMFVMFLVNAFVTPIFWTLRIPYWFKRIKIYLLEKKKNPDKEHYMTQRQLNIYYEFMDMNVSYKYAYLAKTAAMTFFYLPIFPMGFIISFLGFILGYLLELYNFTHLYKRPEMLDESISKAFADNFIIILFIGGIGDLFFFYEIFPSKAMSLVNFIVFLVLVFVPYTKFLVCNFIGEKNKSEYYPKTLSEVYLEFYNDYQRQNPFTKRLGIKRYLDSLKKAGNLSDNAYQIAVENIDKLNLMEIYYEISRGKIPIHHQSAMANAINYSISGKNMALRKSSINNDIRESTIDQKEKQKYFDNQINLIFKPRQSLASIAEEPEKYPMDTMDDESDTKDRLINAYNNPIAINMGLGPLPMDYNIYDSMPISCSKIPSKNDNVNINVNDSVNDFKKKSSKDIKEKIKNDINNYRNKKNNKENIKNTSNNSLTNSSLIKDKNNNINNYIIRFRRNGIKNFSNYTIGTLKSKHYNHSSIFIPFLNSIFIISGSKNKKCESFYILNEKTEFIPSLNYSRENSGLCLINEKILYVFFGFNRNISKFLTSFEKLDLNEINNKENFFWEIFNVPGNPNLIKKTLFSCIYYKNNDKDGILIIGGKNNKRNDCKDVLFFDINNINYSIFENSDLNDVCSFSNCNFLSFDFSSKDLFLLYNISQDSKVFLFNCKIGKFINLN
jgi:hypothetical protein